MKIYKLIVIGKNLGGVTAANYAGRMGVKVALIDNMGKSAQDISVIARSFSNCAKRVFELKREDCFGMSVEGEVSFLEIIKKLKRDIEGSRSLYDIEEEAKGFVEVFRSACYFVDKNTLRLEDGELIFGEKIIISAPSKQSLTGQKDLENIKDSTLEDILSLERLPASIVIIGGDPAVIEMADGFNKLGTKVTIITDGERLLRDEDREITDILFRNFEAMGIKILLNTSICGVSKNDESFRVKLQSKAKAEENFMELETERVFLVGERIPDIDELNLGAAGIIVEGTRVKTDETLRTNVPSIYAIGDTRGVYPLPNKSEHEAQVAVGNALFELKRSVRYDNIPNIIYTSPQVFRVGFSEDLARGGFNHVSVYRYKFQGRNSLILNRKGDIEENSLKATSILPEGIIKIITDNKKRIIGAHAMIDGAEDIMQELVYALTYKHRVQNIAKVFHSQFSQVAGIKECADSSWKQGDKFGEAKGLTKIYHKLFRKRQ